MPPYTPLPGQLTGIQSNRVGGGELGSSSSAPSATSPGGSNVFLFSKGPGQTEFTQQFGGSFGSTPITSQSLSQQSPISLPSAGGATSVGGSGVGANSAGAFASAISGLQSTADATLKSGEAKKKDENQLDTGGLAELVKSLYGQVTPVNSAEIYAQQEAAAGIVQKQQLVNDYTAQLNAITANAQAAQLAVTGQGRGIPETIIGGQQAQIAKEAAIQALPIAAQLSAAQGNLQMAQQHVDTYSKLLISDAQARRDQQLSVIQAVIPFATAAEQRRLSVLDQQSANATATTRDNVNFAQSLVNTAISNGNQAAASGIMKLMATPNSPTFMQDVAAYAGQIQPKASGSNTTIDNERALFNQFNGEPIVKDYNTILAKKQSVDAILSSKLGGPGDLALVYEFMKGLDPTSVVRETEYASAAKSGNIFAGQFAKFNGYLKPEGGFLPEQVKTSFQSIVNSKLKVQQQLYDNVKKQYEGVASRQNLDPRNVVIDYGAANIEQPVVPQNDNDLFDEVVSSGAKGGYFSRLWNSLLGN